MTMNFRPERWQEVSAKARTRDFTFHPFIQTVAFRDIARECGETAKTVPPADQHERQNAAPPERTWRISPASNKE